MLRTVIEELRPDTTGQYSHLLDFVPDEFVTPAIEAR